jgi:hypothetical protein
MPGDMPWEDALLERKSESDTKDLLKTLAAFANSVRPGHVAEILIGELNDGSIKGVSDPDRMQKRVREECDKIYPAIVCKTHLFFTSLTGSTARGMGCSPPYPRRPLRPKTHSEIPNCSKVI